MGRRGFTLVELMLAVAMIAILATIALPQFAAIARKAAEARTKGNLGTIRSALAIYYGDNEGAFPTDNLASLVEGQKYLPKIPIKSTPPYHPDSSDVSAGPWSAMADARGDWFYVNDPLDAAWGRVMVNCIHDDLKGVVWSSY